MPLPPFPRPLPPIQQAARGGSSSRWALGPLASWAVLTSEDCRTLLALTASSLQPLCSPHACGCNALVCLLLLRSWKEGRRKGRTGLTLSLLGSETPVTPCSSPLGDLGRRAPSVFHEDGLLGPGCHPVSLPRSFRGWPCARCVVFAQVPLLPAPQGLCWYASLEVVVPCPLSISLPSLSTCHIGSQLFAVVSDLQPHKRKCRRWFLCWEGGELLRAQCGPQAPHPALLGSVTSGSRLLV